MSVVTFYLDSKEDENKQRQVFLNVRYQGKRYRMATGKKVNVSKWDDDKGEVNPRKYKENPIGFNSFLSELKKSIVSLTNDNEPISAADIRILVEKANGKETNDTFFGFCKGYLKQQIDKGELLPVSAKAYQGTLNHLEKINRKLAFKDIDLNFYDRFVTTLRSGGLAPNSIGGHIKRVKWFMSAALDRDFHTNVNFRKKSFKATREETDQIYLTRKEVKILSKKSLAPRLKRVADAFVLNCYLGQRYSDWAQMLKPNFHKQADGLFHWMLVQDKTGEKMDVPVPHDVLPILKKYNFTCPVISAKGKLMSVQKFNDYLKEAAATAELNAIEDVRSNGQVTKRPKHELIKSHTARRTFATNLYLDGVPIQNIMAITGHRKEETFLLYVRADQLTKSKGLAKHYQMGSKPIMNVTKGGNAA